MRMRSTTTVLLLAGLALLGVSCGDGDDTASTGDRPDQDGDQPDGETPGDAPATGADALVGRVFLSESVSEDGQARPLVDGTQIRISFEDEGQLGMEAGCNHLFGNVEVTADQLVVDGLGGTAMGCDQPRMDQDTWLVGLMDADPGYSLDGDRLRLESGSTVIELVDREVADPDRPLESTTWQLDGMVQGSGPDATASSVPSGASAGIVVEGGNVTVTNEGCNGGSGSATVDTEAGTITFDGIITTRMACPQPQMQVEEALTTVLQGEVAYTIEARSLTLTHPDGAGLTFRAAE
jgi:heat shock protein HslJ